MSQSSDPKDRHDGEVLARLDRLSAQVEMLLLDRQYRRRQGAGLAVNGSLAGRPADAVLGNDKAYQLDADLGSPLDSIAGTSVTLEQAVAKFERWRDADTHAAASDQPESV